MVKNSKTEGLRGLLTDLVSRTTLYSVGTREELREYGNPAGYYDANTTHTILSLCGLVTGLGIIIESQEYATHGIVAASTSLVLLADAGIRGGEDPGIVGLLRQGYQTIRDEYWPDHDHNSQEEQQ